MKNRAVLVSALLIAALAVVVGLVAWWNREPTYQGKSFSYWINQLPAIELGRVNIQLAAWFALETVAPEEFQKQKHPPILGHDHGRR